MKLRSSPAQAETMINDTGGDGADSDDGSVALVIVSFGWSSMAALVDSIG